MTRHQTVWDTIHELVEKVEDPSIHDLQALACMLGENDRAIREQTNLIRKTAKDLDKITDGETLRVEHTVEDGNSDELEELLDAAEDLF